jgi:hypothetical protein
VVTFTDDALTNVVFEFFARQAHRSGWTIDKYSASDLPAHSRNLPFQWSRSLPGGGHAAVYLLPTDGWAPHSKTYRLTGSASQ